MRVCVCRVHVFACASVTTTVGGESCISEHLRDVLDKWLYYIKLYEWRGLKFSATPFSNHPPATPTKQPLATTITTAHP